MHHLRSVESTSAAEERRIKEVTLKSFSPTRHIRYPGFQLLSIISPHSINSSASVAGIDQTASTFSDSLCLFPDQNVFYLSRYPLALLSITFVILIYNYRTPRPLRLAVLPPPMHLISHPSPSATGASANPYNPNYPGSPMPQSAASEFSQFAPFSPTSPLAPPKSPYGALPPMMRTPTGDTLAAPHLRAMNHSSSPRAHTPQSSGMLSPTSMFMRRDDDDEDAEHDAEDAMYPSHYMGNGDDRSPNGNGNGSTASSSRSPSWTGSKYGKESKDSYFLPAPLAKRSRDDISWSWTFVYRGRRRRMTIRWPRFLAGGGSSGVEQGPRGRTADVLGGTAKDFVRVVWPALLFWLSTLWWIL